MKDDDLTATKQLKIEDTFEAAFGFGVAQEAALPSAVGLCVKLI